MRVMVVAIILLTACDPGWAYFIPGVQHVDDDGYSYPLLLDNGRIRARFHSTVFTINGFARIAVENTSDAPIDFAFRPTRIVDAEGKSLATSGCTYEPMQQPSLEPGETVTISCRYQIGNSRAGCSSNPKYKTITLRQEGFSAEDRQILIEATMVSL